MKFLTAVAAIVGGFAAGAALAAEPVEVLVLGTYHLDNPRRDLHNVDVDDVLQPKRQRELEALADALARFRPTKILIERVSEDLVDPGFAAFTPEALGEQRDERVQIAYRLAHKLRHRRVYAINEREGPGEPDYFPFPKVEAYAKAHGQEAHLRRLMDEAAAATRATGARQARASIPDLLIDYNRDDGPLSGIGPYYEILRIGGIEDQPGAELNAMWYMRNAKIFAKLMKVAEAGDRLLVVYGGGHGFWLRHFARHTPGFRNVDAIPYLKRAAAKVRK
jgi:hypothetical protein